MAAYKPEPIRRGFTFAHAPESPLNANMTGVGELLSPPWVHIDLWWLTGRHIALNEGIPIWTRHNATLIVCSSLIYTIYSSLLVHVYNRY